MFYQSEKWREIVEWLKIKRYYVIAVIIVIAGYGIYRSVNAFSTHTKSVHPILVEAAAVKLQTMPVELEATGNLAARNEINITSEFPGKIDEILFQDGMHVKAGAALFRLDGTIYEAALRGAQADLELSEQYYNRITKLVKRDAQAQHERDKAFADLRDKQAVLETKKAELSKMLIKAPFDGIVGARKVSMGDFVNTGEELVQLVDKQHLKVNYYLPERYLSQLKIGQQVIVTTEAFPDKTFTGNVSYIAPAVDVETHNIELEADIPNSQELLSPGLYVIVRQIIDNQKHVLVIPEQALMSTITGQAVYKVVDGKALKTTVEVGTRASSMAQILSGLKEGDVVIIAGQQKLRDGASVQVKT